jgi:hypothetical protein
LTPTTQPTRTQHTRLQIYCCCRNLHLAIQDRAANATDQQMLYQVQRIYRRVPYFLRHISEFILRVQYLLIQVREARRSLLRRRQQTRAPKPSNVFINRCTSGRRRPLWIE